MPRPYATTIINNSQVRYWHSLWWVGYQRLLSSNDSGYYSNSFARVALFE